DVDADSGLVDDENPGVRGEPFGDANFLLVASRQVAYCLVEAGCTHVQASHERPNEVLFDAAPNECAYPPEPVPNSYCGVAGYRMREDEPLPLAVLRD